MAFKPLQNRFGRVRRDQHVESFLRHPPTGEGAQNICPATAMRTWALRNWDPRLLRSTPDDEPEAAQDPPSLMAVEIGPVEAGGKADHLLGRKAFTGDHDEMIAERFRHDVAKELADLARIERKFPLSNPRSYLIHTYYIALIVSAPQSRSFSNFDLAFRDATRPKIANY